MWNFHVWRTLVWPLCNGSEWWWYLWKGNLSLFWTNQTRLLSLAWFWSCGRMKKKKWDFDHLPEMTLCTVQRSPRGKQNYFSYGPFNGLSDPHTFVPARHTFQICRLNHICICINSLCLFVCLFVQAVTSLFTVRFSKVWYGWNQRRL